MEQFVLSDQHTSLARLRTMFLLYPGSIEKVSYIASAGQYHIRVCMKIIFWFIGLHVLVDLIVKLLMHCLQDTVLELEFQGIEKFSILQVADHVIHFACIPAVCEPSTRF